MADIDWFADLSFRLRRLRFRFHPWLGCCLILLGLAWPSALAQPAITLQPRPVRALAGENVNLSVQATGQELSYDWHQNGESSGRASFDGVLNLTNVTPQFEGQWFVVVRNNAGSVTSAPVRLTLCANALNTTFNGRPWVKLFATEDPLPGTPNRLGPFTTPFEPILTLWTRRSTPPPGRTTTRRIPPCSRTHCSAGARASSRR